MHYNNGMVSNYKIEVVVNNVVDDAIEAVKHGVDRFELVSAIELGGCTPTIGPLKEIRKACGNVEIVCMNRPRGGNFVYSQKEFESMLEDTKSMIENGADGIVFGFLHEDNSLDEEKTKQMIDLIHTYKKEAIFHKASDMVNDLDATVEKLIELGIDRIMTNGAAKEADLSDGCAVMAALQDKYGSKVQFLFGGGIRANNIKRCLETSKTNQVHMTSKTTSASGYTCLDPIQLDEILSQLR